LADAPPVVDVDAAAAVVAVPVPAEAPAVVAPPVDAAGVVATVGPGTAEVVFKHELSVPALTVKDADCATAPLASRRVKPRLVPDWMLTVQVREVVLSGPKLSRAALVGEAPGRILR